MRLRPMAAVFVIALVAVSSPAPAVADTATSSMVTAALTALDSIPIEGRSSPRPDTAARSSAMRGPTTC